MFDDIVKEKKKEKESWNLLKPGVYVREIDLSHVVPELKLHDHLLKLAEISSQIPVDENVYYNGIEIGTPKEINKALDMADKLADKFEENKKEIDNLANFLMKNYGQKICGSAVDTAINILSDVKSIEYYVGRKDEYKNGVIVGANGTVEEKDERII